MANIPPDSSLAEALPPNALMSLWTNARPRPQCVPVSERAESARQKQSNTFATCSEDNLQPVLEIMTSTELFLLEAVVRILPPSLVYSTALT